MLNILSHQHISFYTAGTSPLSSDFPAQKPITLHKHSVFLEKCSALLQAHPYLAWITCFIGAPVFITAAVALFTLMFNLPAILW